MIPKRSSRGFTLIELIMVMIIMSIISVVLAKFLMSTLNSFTTEYQLSEIENQGTMVMNRLSNDIQNIRTPADISTINSNAFAFTDINGNTISYTVSGTQLLRNSITIIDNLSSISLGYLNASGATTGTAASVVYVTLSLTLAKGSLSETFATTISTRFTQ